MALEASRMSDTIPELSLQSLEAVDQQAGLRSDTAEIERRRVDCISGID